MDNPKPTAAGGRAPEVDPAASSMPAVDRPNSAPIISAIGTTTQASTDRAARRALLLCASALERHEKAEIVSVIGALLAGLPVHQVLGALEDLAGSREDGGERS
jgi:hypothetical protein